MRTSRRVPVGRGTRAVTDEPLATTNNVAATTQSRCRRRGHARARAKITKRFGGLVAVRSVDFDIPKGASSA